jgi:hypothetical protein
MCSNVIRIRYQNKVQLILSIVLDIRKWELFTPSNINISTQ